MFELTPYIGNLCAREKTVLEMHLERQKRKMEKKVSQAETYVQLHMQGAKMLQEQKTAAYALWDRRLNAAQAIQNDEARHRSLQLLDAELEALDARWNW